MKMDRTNVTVRSLKGLQKLGGITFSDIKGRRLRYLLIIIYKKRGLEQTCRPDKLPNYREKTSKDK